MDVLYAHSRSAVSQVRHILEDHLRGSAALAQRFGEPFGAGCLAGYLALVHDVGKGTCVWQHKLGLAERRGGRVGEPHKHAGTELAAKYVAMQFGGIVHGHHGGLPDLESLKDELSQIRSGRHKVPVEEAIRRVGEIIPEIHPNPRPQVPAWLRDGSLADQRLGLDLLMRMLFSCVVDADFLDTAGHFSNQSTQLSTLLDMEALVSRYESRRERLLAGRKPSPVDAIREEVYARACEAAAGTPGMYRLHVPTGGAKTIAAGGFGLRHAAVNGLCRIVLAVPYISITQQNAAVYRDLLDPAEAAGLGPVVLEHHSSVDLDLAVFEEGVSAEEMAKAEARRRSARLAAENWDAQFVITTTVQLFESLFSRKPSAMRKLHRLAGAVIILDEVQALPDRLLVPILSVLRALVENYGSTVLLASATQPDFWSLKRFQGLHCVSVIDDPSRMFKALRRVRYEWRVSEDVTLESIAEEAALHEQALTVVNTTKDAATFHRTLQDRCDPHVDVLHLSTRMTASHRREVIDQIRTLLADGQPVQVVSTQLIEAGVDLDFPRVYRAWAPVESLQQAAGRCNRDGRQVGPGVVVIFRAVDGGQPKGGAYRAALDATGMYFGPQLAEPDNLQALQKYYAQRYSLQQGAPDSGLGTEIDDLRRKLDFPQVAELFRMVEDGVSTPVVVIRKEDDRDAIEDATAQLRSPFPCGPEVLRSFQPHTASLPRHEAEEAVRSGLADPIVGDMLLWRGAYHVLRGLDPAMPEDVSEFIQ